MTLTTTSNWIPCYTLLLSKFRSPAIPSKVPYVPSHSSRGQRSPSLPRAFLGARQVACACYSGRNSHRHGDQMEADLLRLVHHSSCVEDPAYHRSGRGFGSRAPRPTTRICRFPHRCVLAGLVSENPPRTSLHARVSDAQRCRSFSRYRWCRGTRGRRERTKELRCVLLKTVHKCTNRHNWTQAEFRAQKLCLAFLVAGQDGGELLGVIIFADHDI